MAGGSSNRGTIPNMTFAGVGNLMRLLPTGTVFLFQFLSPVLTNNGQCTMVNKYLTWALLGVCGFSCLFSSFTDSYTGTDGITHYGIATMTGLWPSANSNSADMSRYRLRLSDFAHGFLSLTVFGVVALLDPNTANCFYPSFMSTQKMLLMVLPPVVGAIASSVFMIFPTKRHGIGYPSSQASEDSKS